MVCPTETSVIQGNGIRASFPIAPGLAESLLPQIEVSVSYYLLWHAVAS